MSERTHDRVMLTGVGACGLAVAAYSSWAQFSIATAAGYPVALAWVVPVATDATAALGTRAWMSPNYGDKVRGYGQRLACMAIGLSVLTAALHLVVPTTGPVPWQLRLAIGGLPSLALAAVIHLGALTAKDKPRARPSAKSRDKSARETASSQAVTAAANAQTPTARTVSQVATTEHGMNLSTFTPPPAQSGDAGNTRARMMAHLDQHPAATGADLDAKFGTTSYGRKVRRDWEKNRGLHLVNQASGE